MKKTVTTRRPVNRTIHQEDNRMGFLICVALFLGEIAIASTSMILLSQHHDREIEAIEREYGKRD